MGTNDVLAIDLDGSHLPALANSQLHSDESALPVMSLAGMRQRTIDFA